MTFQTVTVTWSESDEALTPVGGTVTFQLTRILVDSSGAIAEPALLTYPFTGGTGQSDPLAANDSAGSSPSGTAYRITVQPSGLPVRQFFAQILYANGGTQTLGFLEANASVPASRYATYMPQPSGSAAARDLPFATGSGEASQWGTLEASDIPDLSADYLAPDGDGSALTGITAGQVGADTSGAAAGAQAAAESYADGVAGTAQSNAEAYAGSAASTAQTDAETFATSAVGTETTRAETAEGTLSTAVSAETTRAESAEAALLPLSGGTVTGDVTLEGNVTVTGAGVEISGTGQYSANAAGTALMRLGQKANGEIVWSWNVDQNSGDAIDDPGLGALKFSMEAGTDYTGMEVQYSPPGGTWDGSTVFSVDGEGNTVAAGTVEAAGFSGDGSELTGITASQAGAAAAASVLSLAATTGIGGYTLLTDGTGPVISWTAPDDGNMHRIEYFSALYVSSTETGGEIEITCTLPNGEPHSGSVQGGGAGTGSTYYTDSALVYPGTTVQILQSTPLTGGAAVFWCEIWAL